MFDNNILSNYCCL